MATIKFSAFTAETNPTNIDFLVGYEGTTMKKIDPANLGGATNLNELTDCLVDIDSLYVGEVPSGLSGNPQNNTILGIDSGTALTSGNSNTLIGNDAGAGISTGSGFTVVGKNAGNGATYTGSNVTLIGYDAEASSATVSNEITLGDSNITSFRIPGIQSGASDGDVLTYNASAGKLELQAGGGGGASDLNGLSDVSIDLTNDSAYFINIPSGISGAVGNIGLGEEALNSITSGSYNTAIGKQALNNSTTSERSTAIGYNAGAAAGTNLQLNTVLIGDNAGFGRSGYRTVAIGSGAMGFGSGKTAVNRNTAIGYRALYRIDTNGADNIALGHEASQFLTTATQNIAIGDNAARSSTSNGHISIGYQAGYSNTSGSANTNLGYQAGYSNTTNGENVNVGYNAGKTATGSQNVAVGRNAFGDGFGHSGTGNVAMGYLALSSPSGASSKNVAIGSEALKANGTKSNNVAVGYKSGLAITTGSNNVSLGYQSLYTETSGQRNTAIGYEALKNQNQQFAAHNTAVGWQADDGNTNGYYRTNIGAATGQGNATGTNVTNIGYQATESSATASNEITLGDSSVATLRCAVTSITSLSDERDKTEIKDLGYGLAFIDALQPREFVWNNRAETNKDGEEFYSSNKGKKDFGFIAQEVKELDNDTLRLVYDENPDKLELSYGKLVPILVQAIKELKEEVELLKS